MLLYLFIFSLRLSANANPEKAKDGLSEKDHKAFLGKDEAKIYDDLTPEESKEKLVKLFHKVDEQMTADGFVTEEELKKWMQYTQNRYIREDSDEQMKQNDADKDGFVTWEEYKKATYGFLDEHEGERDHYKEMLARDVQHFELADKDKDRKLSLDEFSAFLHPENYDHMKGIVVNETLQDVDKDKDGYITLEEYLGDLWPKEDRAKGEEPDWVKTEREQFSEFLDKNNDGIMDPEEVKDWILPPDYHFVTSEAKHLISESDLNKDGKISKEEMVEKYDLFVGSQATDFGDIFETKDEL